MGDYEKKFTFEFKQNKASADATYYLAYYSLSEQMQTCADKFENSTIDKINSIAGTIDKCVQYKTVTDEDMKRKMAYIILQNN